MPEINQGKIFLKAAIHALVAGVKELPAIGIPLKMGAAFYETWTTELEAAQDALPETERPEQLQQAAAITPEQARAVAQAIVVEITQQGQTLEPAQQEAIIDVATILPARIRERTHATLSQAQRCGTLAHIALPVSARATLQERAEFYRSLLPASRPQFRPGDVLPHANPEWRLIELLGTGGFGEVWHCRHEYLGDEQAVKFCQNPAINSIVQREAKNLFLLRQRLFSHPHIVPLHDLQLQREPLWLAFEYVPDGTLEALMRARGAMPWQDALALFNPLLEAMKQVHELGIVHRDLKPANILLDAQGQPKISDFGIGKIVAESTQMATARSRSSQAVTTRGFGSTGYMSPEQEEGEIAHPADDTYALGIIFWQMLTGGLGRVPRYPKEIQALTLPEAGKELLSRCRFLPREERPQHAGILVQQLQPLLDQLPVAKLQASAGGELKLNDLFAPFIEEKRRKERMEADFKKIVALHDEFPQATEQHKQAWQQFVAMYPMDSFHLDKRYLGIVKKLYLFAHYVATCDKVHGHYAIHTNGTVIDIRTKLMWKRCAEGQTWDGTTCNGQATKMKWDNIMPNKKQKSWPKFADYDDWRVPTLDELTTLVYCSSGKPKKWVKINEASHFICEGEHQKPTIDLVAFPNTPSEDFLSTHQNSSGFSEGVNFSHGSNTYTSNSHAVRLVRGLVA